MVLSDKSSGSSALQDALLRSDGVHTVAWTRHNENETLYWVKAAAVLGLPQPSMLGSSLPFAAEAARRELVRFLSENVPGYVPPGGDEELVFDGWRTLCHGLAPVFLEKSPHHLHSTSALELLLEAERRIPDVDFLYVGLVRDPLDTLYSMWRRWRLVPEEKQHEWLRAYRNLIDFRARVGDRMATVRYEDLVQDPRVMEELCRFVGVPWEPAMVDRLHAGSLGRWRSDPGYGYAPDPALTELARRFGYAEADRHEPVWWWPLSRRVRSRAYRMRRVVGKMRARARGAGGLA